MKDVTPAPFLRTGFAILSVGVALAIWHGQAPGLGWWAALPAGLAFLIVSGVGEMLFRRLATPEQRRADLEDRVRNGD